MDVPVTYRAQNLAQGGLMPASVKICDNATINFYRRWLMKRAIAALDFTLPEEWPHNYVSYTLFGRGFGGIFRQDRYGVVFQGGTVFGRNVYFQPTNFICANPLFSTPSNGWRIGQNCAVVKLQPDYSGFEDVVVAFANRLALAYQAWQMNTQNSKLSYVFVADNKAQSATFQKLFDKIQSGEPAVAAGNNLFDKTGKPLWGTFSNDVKQNYVAPLITEDMRSIMAEFDSFVGIPNNNSNKRERQIVDEVNANNVETDTLLDLAVRTLSKDFEKANDMFGLSLAVRKRYPMEGVTENA